MVIIVVLKIRKKPTSEPRFKLYIKLFKRGCREQYQAILDYNYAIKGMYDVYLSSSIRDGIIKIAKQNGHTFDNDVVMKCCNFIRRKICTHMNNMIYENEKNNWEKGRPTIVATFKAELSDDANDAGNVDNEVFTI